MNKKPIMNNNPIISIICPSWNPDKRAFSIFLNSVKKSRYPKNKLETIIIDNGSIDDSISFLKKKFPWVRIIRLKENYGYPKAANIGIAESKGEYIFIANNDIELEKNCLENLISYLLNHPEAGEVGGRIYDYYKRNKIMGTPLSYNLCTGQFKTSGDYNKTQEAVWISGLCMFSKKLFNKLGGFDEDFFYSGDDLDFCLRLGYKGLRVVYFPDAVLWHMGGQTINKPDLSNFKIYNIHKSRLRILFKHGFVWEIIAGLLFEVLVSIPFKLLIQRTNNIPIFFKALVWNLRNFPVNISSQREERLDVKYNG